MVALLFDLAYAVALVVVAADLVGREKGVLADSKNDRGSTAVVAVAVVCSFVSLPLLASTSFSTVQWGFLGLVGLAMMAAGIAVRVWARAVLGRYYSLSLKTASGQSLVDKGPYARVRHPGYSGYLLMWFGLAVASTSGLAILLIAALMGPAYAYRIRNEEAMLAVSLGVPYQQYMKRTKRLVPFVY